MLYLEFGASPDCDPRKWPTGHVDLAQVALANPSYPHRTQRAAVLRMMKNLGPESFAREGLGLWDDDHPRTPPLISPETWASLKGEAPKAGLTCWGIRVAPTTGQVALTVARRPDDGGPVHVEVIDERNITDGVAWLTDWFTAGDRPRWNDAAQIVIDGSGSGGVIGNALNTAGVPKRVILFPNVNQVITANAELFNSAHAQGLTHAGQPGLDEPAGRAAKRDIGNKGGWGWESTDGGSVAALEAAALALWGAKTTRRRPGRGGGVIR
jgi:hypothetical protein